MTGFLTKRWSLLAIAVIACGAWATAQPKPQTATDFYKSYRAAVAKATKVDDIVPFLSADVKAQVEATPADQRPQLFQMMKMMTQNRTMEKNLTLTGYLPCP